ncbi:MAG: outer membrane protein transport protein [Dysgonamonadaceae bacterium]|jgi:hypothetical protein|nr:outer membrane protein transport protein [Dysgonamonadaceae bacterium]
MKKITYIFVSFLFVAASAFAQGEIDALRYSRNDLYGTARSMAMGGAFGALGGDQTGVSINPAGIAVYRSSEVVGTLGLNNEYTEVGGVEKSKFFGGFDNLGFISYFPLRSNSVPLVNFGFTYNRLKSFDKKYRAEGANRSSSLTDYIAKHFWDTDPLLLGNDSNVDPFYRSDGAPWMPILAYQGFLTYPVNGGYESILDPNDKVSNVIDMNDNNMDERGSIESYDFTIGTSINNKLNLGLALTVTSIDYSTYSIYTENFPSGNNEGFDLENYFSTSGAGVGVKLGFIYRPVNSLRFGVSYHSPTWYNMTDNYYATLDYKVDSYIGKLSSKDQAEYNGIENRRVGTGEDYFDYSFRTPDKWTFSLASVMNDNFILSLDYELTNYKGMRYYGETASDAFFGSIESLIKQDYKAASSVRIGGEYRFTPQFSGRLGYAWTQNPYGDTYRAKGDAVISGSTTIPYYRMEGDANYYTCGLGYRFNRNYYLDFALVVKTQSDDFYPFPNIWNDSRTELVLNAEPYKMNNNTVRGVFTLGYRF